MLAFEGPIPDGILGKCLRQDRAPFRITTWEGPYKNKNLWGGSHDIVLLTRAGMQVAVLNGKVDDSQALTSVYAADGTVTESEVARLRASGDCIVDFVGHVETEEVPGKCFPYRSFKGMTKRPVADGNVVLVEKARGSAPATDDFEIIRFGKIRATQGTDWSECTMHDPGTALPPDTIPVMAVYDPRTDECELLTGLMPDGSLVFTANVDDDIVLVIDGCARAFTKAELLGPKGELQQLADLAPSRHPLMDQIRAIASAFDPVRGVLIITVEPDGTTVNSKVLPRPGQAGEQEG